MTKDVVEGLFDLEETVRDAADRVLAICMLGSSEECQRITGSDYHALPIGLANLGLVAKERTRFASLIEGNRPLLNRQRPSSWNYADGLAIGGAGGS